MLNERTVAAMMDELEKISGFNNSNYAAPAKTGMGGNITVATVPRTGVPKAATTGTKNTNYSIVNSTPSTASGGNASMTSKAVAPPPVKA